MEGSGVLGEEDGGKQGDHGRKKKLFHKPPSVEQDENMVASFGEGFNKILSFRKHSLQGLIQVQG